VHIEADTLDDLLRKVFQRLLRSKNRPSPTKGANREEIGALLTIRKPRARFSRTERRATLFSCLGETLWYFSGSDRLDVIEYYIRGYRGFSSLSEGAAAAPGAYGPRLFGASRGKDQVAKIIQMLKDPNKHDTRQAVIQIFDKRDIGKLDVPCTCNIQFFARGKLLHCYVSMRSNDAYLGLPHDVFAFTMLQELIARSIDHEIGEYHHAVGSLHLYDANEGAARDFLSEGWQSTTGAEMPPMPRGDPFRSLSWLLAAEAKLRNGDRAILPPEGTDPYWIDLARLLLIKALYDAEDRRGIVRESRLFESKVYENFVRGKVRHLAEEEKAQLSLPNLRN
jgi:thymidylate synthase